MVGREGLHAGCALLHATLARGQSLKKACFTNTSICQHLGLWCVVYQQIECTCTQLDSSLPGTCGISACNLELTVSFISSTLPGDPSLKWFLSATT